MPAAASALESMVNAFGSGMKWEHRSSPLGLLALWRLFPWLQRVLRRAALGHPSMEVTCCTGAGYWRYHLNRPSRFISTTHQSVVGLETRRKTTLFRERFKHVWGRLPSPPKPTALLTRGGLLTRDSESFRSKFRGAEATPMVAFGPWFFSLETENLASAAKSA